MSRVSLLALPIFITGMAYAARAWIGALRDWREYREGSERVPRSTGR